MTLEPVADAHVYASSPGSNYGLLQELIVDRSNHRTFLRFDLSTVPGADNLLYAALEMIVFTGFAYGGDGTVYVEEAASDAWGETTITWSNQPGVVGPVLGSWWQWYNNNTDERLVVGSSDEMLDAVVDAIDTDGSISYRLHSPGYRTNYRSREYGDAARRPKLRLRYLPLSSCAEVFAQNPSAAEGDYVLDTDGAGPLAPQSVHCSPALVMAGPVFVNNIGGWANSGMAVRPKVNVTLQSFIFRNQGNADTIQLVNHATGTVLQTIAVPAGDTNYFVNANWDLDAGVTYRIIAVESSNGRWVDYTSYPTSNDHLDVLGVWGSGAIQTSWWFHFNDFTTIPR